MTPATPTIATTLLLLLAGSDLCAQDPAPAEAVAPLTWSELFARPELWPRHCRAQPGLRFEGHTTVADHDYEIYTIESDRIGVALPGGTYGSLKPELTSALEIANAAYAAVSP